MFDRTHHYLEQYLTFYYEYSKSHKPRVHAHKKQQKLSGSKGGRVTGKKS